MSTDNTSSILDARTLEEVELADDPERDDALHQMVQEYGGLLEFLSTTLTGFRNREFFTG